MINIVNKRQPINPWHAHLLCLVKAISYSGPSDLFQPGLLGTSGTILSPPHLAEIIKALSVIVGIESSSAEQKAAEIPLGSTIEAFCHYQ